MMLKSKKKFKKNPSATFQVYCLTTLPEAGDYTTVHFLSCMQIRFIIYSMHTNQYLHHSHPKS